MRVYLPVTTTELRALLAAGSLGPPPLTGFALTPGLREWYRDDGSDDHDEELEYAALSEAARSSLRLIDADPTAAPRRAGAAAEVPDTEVTVRDDLDRGVVRLAAPVPLAAIAAVHLDDPDAERTVAAAARAIVRADLGDDAAQDAVDDAEGFELSWYATQELEHLLADL